MLESERSSGSSTRIGKAKFFELEPVIWTWMSYKLKGKAFNQQSFCVLFVGTNIFQV